MAHERLQAVALGHGDIKAADLIAVPEPVEPDEAREGLVQRFGVPLEVALPFDALGCHHHSCYYQQ